MKATATRHASIVESNLFRLPLLKKKSLLRVVVVAMGCVGASIAPAAEIHVTNLADSGAGSLRSAIAIAAPGDSIVFDGTGTITLSSTLTMSKNLTISGPGASNLAISGNNSVGVCICLASHLQWNQ